MDKFFVHYTSIIDEGAKVGEGTSIWHFCHIMSNAIIGNDCVVGQNVFIGQNVRIGNKVKIQNNVSLYDGVICEDEVFVGPSVVFTNVMNPRSTIERKSEFKETIIKRGASIGANATIVCGNILGRFSFIGAGAVVLDDVADYALIVGNPGVQIGWISEAGIRLHFDLDNNAICSETNEQYSLVNGILTAEYNG